MYSDLIFHKILEDAKSDPSILGIILGGSRGKGFTTKHSDYDLTIIVIPDVKDIYEHKFDEMGENFDVGVSTLDEFEKYAEWGGSLMWDRYNFAHVKASLDKTGGRLQAIIDKKSEIPQQFVQKFISENLDAYINQVYRSMKCLRDKSVVGYRLEAAESIPVLLNCLFAIHENRLRPYSKYLVWELSNYPLKKLTINPDHFINLILQILETGEYKSQQLILREVERIFRAEGFGEVFNSWEGDDKWAMNYNPEK